MTHELLQGNIPSRVAGNSEVFASELPETLEGMFSWYQMMLYGVVSNTQWCVIRCRMGQPCCIIMYVVARKHVLEIF